MIVYLREEEGFNVICIEEGPFITDEYYFAESTHVAFSDGTLVSCHPENKYGIKVIHKGSGTDKAFKEGGLWKLRLDSEKIEWFIFGDRSDVFNPIRF